MTPGVGAAPIDWTTERSSASEILATNLPRELSCVLSIKILQLTYLAIHRRSFLLLPAPLTKIHERHDFKRRAFEQAV
jgi:hypothetical protein